MLITFEMRLPAETHQKGRWWIASCPPLDVASQGHSEAEALTNLEDALVFFIESCVERGTIFDVLRDAGFSLLPPGARPPEDTSERLTVRVPLPFVGSAEQQKSSSPGTLA